MQGIGPVLFLIGCLMVLACRTCGVLESRRQFRTRVKQVHHRRVRMMASYAYERDANLVLDPDRLDDADIDLLAKLCHPDGRSMEYRTVLPVWEACVEVMFRGAVTDGKNLAGFRAVVLR